MTDHPPATLATPLRRIAPGRFQIAEAQYAPGIWLAPHHHARTSFVFVREGDWTEKVNRQDVQLRRGMLFVRRAAVPHANIFGPRGARCLFVECVDEGEPLGPPGLGGARDFAALHHPELARVGFRLAADGWVDDRATALRLEGLALDLVGAALRIADPGRKVATPWVRRAHERLRDECTNPPSMQELACEAGVSATCFARAFRRQYWMSPATVVHLARLEIAMAMMRATDWPLTEVAVKSGFTDQSHLGRIFRRLVGTTPAKYRRDVRRGDTPTPAPPRT